MFVESAQPKKTSKPWRSRGRSQHGEQQQQQPHMPACTSALQSQQHASYFNTSAADLF